MMQTNLMQAIKVLSGSVETSVMWITCSSVFVLLTTPVMLSAGPAISAETEYSLYQQSPTRCKDGDEAARVAFTQYHAWKKKVDDPWKTLAVNNFTDAVFAFAYLYETLECRDPLVVYRYGNLFRLHGTPSYESAIRIMHSSLEGIRTHYPTYTTTVLSSLGQASVSHGQHRQAIEYYEAVLVIDPSEVGTRLNLANQLLHAGDATGARQYAQLALEQPLSVYGREVAEDILRSIDARPILNVEKWQ